jgi:hypothetical protein
MFKKRKGQVTATRIAFFHTLSTCQGPDNQRPGFCGLKIRTSAIIPILIPAKKQINDSPLAM